MRAGSATTSRNSIGLKANYSLNCRTAAKTKQGSRSVLQSNLRSSKGPKPWKAEQRPAGSDVRHRATDPMKANNSRRCRGGCGGSHRGVAGRIRPECAAYEVAGDRVQCAQTIKLHAAAQTK